MPRRSFRSTRRIAPTRKFVWARTASRGIIPAGPNVNQLALLGEFETRYGASLIGATVMRVRGEILIGRTTDVALDAIVVGGIRVVTQTTDPADIEGEGPLVDPEADWMAVFPVILQRALGSTVDSGIHRIAVDVKSARRLEELQQKLYMFWSQDGTNSVDIIAHLSIGLKLP